MLVVRLLDGCALSGLHSQPLMSKDRTAGILVDSARELIPIPPDAIQPQGENIAGFSVRYVEGIATLRNRSILILNLEEVIGGP